MHEAHFQFVVLRHTRGEEVHWDLGLEEGEVLATWQILENPEKLMASPVAVRARRIGDHRRIYLDYEGPISRGRGEVVRVDRGWWTAVEQSAERRRVRLEGRLLSGVFVLERSSEEGDVWSIRREEG